MWTSERENLRIGFDCIYPKCKGFIFENGCLEEVLECK